MRLTLLFVLLIKLVAAQTQSLEWINPKTGLRYRFSTTQFTFIKEMPNGTWAPQALDGLNKAEFEGIGDHIKSHSFALKNDSLVYISLSGSQRVYAYDIYKNRLSRIDRTWNNGYNYNSAQFVRNDTLYSIGGYGFWQYNKLITFFDSNRREWELIPTKGKGPNTIFGGYQGYDPSKDVFYSGASEISSDRMGPLQKQFDSGFYAYNFKGMIWEYLGELNPDLPFKANREIIWNGEYFLHFSGEKLFIANPLKNKVWVVNDGKVFFDTYYLSYPKGDKIICYSEVKPGNITYSIKELLRNSKELGPMYLTPFRVFGYYALIGLGVLACLFIAWKLRKWKQLKIDTKGFFKQQELALIQAFLKISAEEYLTSNDINDILGIRYKGLENQRRIRTNVISMINKKIELQYQIENGIERKDHPEDKRLKLYRLQKKAYDVLSNKVRLY